MKSKGVTKEQTILIPAFFAAGMLLFSNYAGRLGDRRGRPGRDARDRSRRSAFR